MPHATGNLSDNRGASPILVIASLFILGLSFLVVEAFLPGGIVGFVGCCILIGSAVICFTEYGMVTGSIYLLCSFVLAVAVGLTAFLTVAKRLALRPPEPTEPDGGDRIGTEGLTMTALDPTGTIDIDGKRLQARSESSEKLIPEGTTVVVTDTDSTYLIVRPR